MTGTEITIDHIAYAKIFMHALKNSYNDVCGILIGKYYNSENETKKCIISNTVPLFHTHILFAFLSLAFTMVNIILKNFITKINIPLYCLCI